MEPSIVHSILAGFFEVKKVEVKQRLQFEMDRVVVDLFGQLVEQVKQLLPKFNEDNSKSVISQPASVPVKAHLNQKCLPFQDTSASKQPTESIEVMAGKKCNPKMVKDSAAEKNCTNIEQQMSNSLLKKQKANLGAIKLESLEDNSESSKDIVTSGPIKESDFCVSQIASKVFNSEHQPENVSILALEDLMPLSTKISTGKFYAVKSRPLSSCKSRKRTSPSASKPPEIVQNKSSTIKVGHYLTENNCSSVNSILEQKTSKSCISPGKILQSGENKSIKSESFIQLADSGSRNADESGNANQIITIFGNHYGISSKPEKRQISASAGRNSIKKVKTSGDSPKPPGELVCSAEGCGKRFDKKFNLKRHERIHENAKPYRCRWTACSYASVSRSDAIKHIQNVHLARSSKQAGPEQAESQPQVDPKVYLEVDLEMLQ